ncbi:ABC transporter ATP-binding protein [Maledivibacter halophilus]|uniref:Simple sugar transport system ATP-binding protein n=1 Tax=Maledivibacter halophilus TaxID=36842 RepID=A0A1T5J727_9FIRM|nr:ABC transporter ATP-binding protein [Maledivibacter halophilus]SKC47033.1 simple sugar transport system ATP-binding protein [Maledivibacter halophilus]
MEKPILHLRNITKIFPHPEKPIIANDHVNFSVSKGEIHAIVGENGTGKSTLMNILYGIHQPNEGEIILNGQAIHLKNPRQAIEHGIGMVHQHFMLIPSFTVAENLVFGFEPKKGLLVDVNKANRIASKISEKYGLEIDPKQRIQECSLSMQQRVEILKVLYHGANILIFDEPTAVLTPQEANELFKAFKELKDDGKTIIFITHKLKEVMAIADRATVMRKGKVVDVVNISDTSTDELAAMMVGRKISIGTRKNIIKNDVNNEAILEVKNLKCLDNKNSLKLKGISLTLKPGEILGIAGVGGNGQSELVECINGLGEGIVEGQISYKGMDITNYDTHKIRDLGIGHITGERYIRGVCKSADIYENIIMGAHKRAPWSSKHFVNTKNLEKLVDDLIETYSIKTSSKNSLIMNLSGGNVQKCILARELNLAKEIIVAEEPTRGVDIGAIEFIHAQLIKKSQEGYGIVLVSTDLDEIISLSSRILVMFDGKFVGEVTPDEDSLEKKVGLLMAGISL